MIFLLYLVLHGTLSNLDCRFKIRTTHSSLPAKNNNTIGGVGGGCGGGVELYECDDKRQLDSFEFYFVYQLFIIELMSRDKLS